MSFVLVLIVIELWSRRRARYHQAGARGASPRRIALQGAHRWSAFFACLLPVLLGFLLPAGQLAAWAAAAAPRMVDRGFLDLALNSIGLASTAALVVLVLALFMAYGKRVRSSMVTATAVRIAGMGYAVPGTVIAVGVMLPFAWFDNALDDWMRDGFGISTGLLLSGTVFALLFAYSVRFLAVALNSVESGLARIRPSMDDAARSLGLTPGGALRRVHVPLMRRTLLTAGLLVFVDVLKELPATLILRPFNFNTLAVRAYELASDERLADSAPAALFIVLAGIVPVILVSRAVTGRQASRAPLA